MKKFLAIVLALIMVFSLCACGAKAPAAEAPAAAPAAEPAAEAPAAEAAEEVDPDQLISGDIVYLGGTDTSGVMEQIIDHFMELYPNVHVTFNQVPGASDDIKKSLMVSLAAGDSQPDVFGCDCIWVSQFAAAGWLEDVTDYIEPIKDDYLAGPLESCNYEGRLYGFPYYTDVGLLYYRTDIIDTPPTTWEELNQMCIDHKGEGGTEYGFLFQMFQGEPTSCNMLEFVKQNGGWDYKDGAFSMNNEYTIEALEHVEQMMNDGITTKDVLASKPADSLSIFMEGKSIFMRNWTYAYGNLQTSEESKVVDKVGVAKLPVGPNGSESAGCLGGWDYAVNAYSENKEAAILLAKYLSGYEAQKYGVMQGGSTFPGARAVYEDEECLEKYPVLRFATEALDEAKPRPQVKDYPTISTLFAQYFHEALTGAKTNEQAMADMDEALNAALAEMK